MLAAASVLSAYAAKPDGRTKVIAHRGFWNTEDSAKNSLSSLVNAIELECFGTEFDVWVTSDGIPVVFHDEATATGIEIQGTTYDSLVSGAEKLANGETIPTLAEFLRVWNHASVKLVLELKTHRNAARDDWAAARVLECLREYGVQPSEIEYIAFSRHAVKAFVDRGCGSAVSYLNGDLSPTGVKEQLGAGGIDYHMEVLRANPDWIEEAHSIGMTVNVWTVDREADMHWFMNAGVDYITTDRPDALKEMLSIK